jgi:hypothetical protein
MDSRRRFRPRSLVRYDPLRDTGTKEGRPCGSAVEPRRAPFNKALETGPRRSGGNPEPELSGVDSREKLSVAAPGASVP